MELYESCDSALKDSDTYKDHDVIQIVSNKIVKFRDVLIKRDAKIIDNRPLARNLYVISHVHPNESLNVIGSRWSLRSNLF